MIASWFLEEYSDLDYRFAVSEDLYCDEKKFVHACQSGHLAVVKTLVESSDKKILNQVDGNGGMFGAASTAAAGYSTEANQILDKDVVKDFFSKN